MAEDHKTSHALQGSFFPRPVEGCGGIIELPSIDDSVRDSILVSLLALSSAKGIGSKTLCSLFDSGLLQTFIQSNPEEFLLRAGHLAGRHSYDFSKAIRDEKSKLIDNGYIAAEQLRKESISFVPKGYEGYPESLCKLPTPPRWLFVKGSLEAIKSKSIIAAVGTRSPSTEGKRLAYLCAKELAIKNFVVLSGLAKGIDESVHTGAVKFYGQSIAILGHGLLAKYASFNRDLVAQILDNDGAVISEYLPEEPPTQRGFLRRNELIAAMARLLIPIESPSLSSGTGATIRRALSLKTPIVGVIPANVTAPSLLKTKSNITGLGYPVYTVLNNNSKEFWDYVRSTISGHNWTPDPTPRQDRVIRGIIRCFVDSISKNVPFDSKAIARLTGELNLIVQKRGGG